MKVQSMKNVQAVAVRPFMANGSVVMPGQCYTGEDASYLIHLKKCRPIDLDAEMIVTEERNGESIRVVCPRPAGPVAVPSVAQVDPVPDKTWPAAAIREWIVTRDPAAIIPANASKTAMLEWVDDYLVTGEG